MALIKKEATRFGIDAEYWKIGMVSIDRLRKEGSYSLMLYINESATEFIDCKCVSLNELEDKTRYENIFESEDNVIHRCYEDAKLNDEYFATAENDSNYIQELKEGE